MLSLRTCASERARGSSMSISEPSDRAPSTSIDDSESGMGATVDLLDAVAQQDPERAKSLCRQLIHEP